MLRQRLPAAPAAAINLFPDNNLQQTNQPEVPQENSQENPQEIQGEPGYVPILVPPQPTSMNSH